MNDLSVGGKLRVLTLTLLMLWMVFIALPTTAFTSVSSAVGGIQLFGSGSGSNSAQAAPNGSRGGGFEFPIKVGLFLPSPTPRATATPRPTATVRPTAPPRPTAVPPPAAAAAPAPVIPPLPPIEWDSRLGPNGTGGYPDLAQVRIIPTSVGRGQKFWRVVRVKYEDKSEAGNDHTFYIKILGEDGKRANGKKVIVMGEGTGQQDLRDEKSPEDICDCNWNFGMFGDGYSARVDDQYPSETLAGVCMCGIPNQMKGTAHVNFRVTFQLVTNP